MTLPLPLLTPGGAAHLLAEAYMRLDAAAPGLMEHPPCLLLVSPPAWENRYQALLYGSAGPRRYAAVGFGPSSLLREVSWPGPILLHAHWFAWIFKGARDEIEAMERFALLREEVEAFRARTGAKLLWTAHNVFPHGNRFPETFLSLRRWIFESFDALHVMQAAHVAALERAFGLPAPPHFAAPHMTYDGAQPDCVSAEAARLQYGLSPEPFVFGYFGSIQGYKNLDLMLRAFGRIFERSPRPVAALIGGAPSDSDAVQNLLRDWRRHPGVRLEMRHIPDYEIQYLHRAADAMVLPYDEALNSGAAFMAASFRKPILMPAGEASAALEGLGAMTFASATPEALEAAMRAVMAGARGVETLQARARVSPQAVSGAFFDALDGLISRTPSRLTPDRRRSPPNGERRFGRLRAAAEAALSAGLKRFHTDP